MPQGYKAGDGATLPKNHPPIIETTHTSAITHDEESSADSTLESLTQTETQEAGASPNIQESPSSDVSLFYNAHYFKAWAPVQEQFAMAVSSSGEIIAMGSIADVAATVPETGVSTDLSGLALVSVCLVQCFLFQN